MVNCKDCIHFEVCKDYIDIALKGLDDGIINYVSDGCKFFKDRSRFVELPCRVGDTFFVLLKSSDILEYKVFYINIFRGEAYDDINIVLDRNYHRLEFTKERFEYELGKTLFYTREEAKQALKERENNEGR